MKTLRHHFHGAVPWAAIALVAVALSVHPVAAEKNGKGGADRAAGVWELVFPDAADGGGDRFLLEFGLDAKGEMTGEVHTYKDGVRRMAEPLDRVRSDGGRFVWRLPSTGVGFEGEWGASGDTVRGALIIKGEKGKGVWMVRLPADAAGGLRPLPKGASWTYRPPEATGDGWEATTLAEAGLDENAYAAGIAALLEGAYGEVHSILVIRDGRLAAEDYFYGYDREKLHSVQSVTKSVTALLIGAAADRGRIAGPDEPVLSFFEKFAGPIGEGWEKVRLRHILTMSAGLRWDESSLAAFRESDDMYSVPLSRPVAGEPGSLWAYDSQNMALLATVIRRATGVPADRFAAEVLFAPLGIERWDWSEMKRGEDPRCDGTLRLRPRDMGKIGRLVLDGGVWRDGRVLSKEWIDEATGRRVSTGAEEDYGYLWWIADRTIGDHTLRVVFANGWGSQFIFVIPDLRMVVVTTGGNMENDMHFAPVRMIRDFIIGPALGVPPPRG
ncbi:MAG: serine hydrolase [Candidatus Eisenbacteria bacterium]|nr:serine hydrolase [Candidatus Eisenbacteria bacterium]